MLFKSDDYNIDSLTYLLLYLAKSRYIESPQTQQCETACFT